MIRCLVRDQQKADAVSKVSSKVQAVIGDLDDAELVRQEASDADVVFSECAVGNGTEDPANLSRPC